MPYNANVPQASQPINQTQAPILANFQAIQTLINVNHGPFDSATQGKHLVVSMPVQSPAPATAAGERAMYAYTSPFTGNPELAIRAQSNGSIVDFTSAVLANNGWTYLPSGLLMKYGVRNATGQDIVTFPVGPTIPVFSGVFAIYVSIANNFVVPPGSAPNNMVQVAQFTATGFRAWVTNTSLANTNANYSYLALGF